MRLSRWVPKKKDKPVAQFVIDGILRTSNANDTPGPILNALKGTDIVNIGIAYGLRFKVEKETFVVCAFPSVARGEIKVGLIMFPMDLETKQNLSSNAIDLYTSSLHYITDIIVKTFMDDVANDVITLEQE